MEFNLLLLLLIGAHYGIALRHTSNLGFNEQGDWEDNKRRKWSSSSNDGFQDDSERRGYERIQIKMPGVSPKTPEKYLCTSKFIGKQKKYIVDFEADASMNTAHHILVFGCRKPGSSKAYWDCGEEAECEGNPYILYAWARNALPLHLPDGVGFPVGGSTGIQYIVMQVHYARVLGENEIDHSGVILHTTPLSQRYSAGIFLFASGNAEIPPHAKGYHSDMFCRYQNDATLVPFAYRTHTHSLGRAVSAYRVRNEEWTLIGIGNPQLPQAFFPVPKEKRIAIKRNDYLAARCTFDSTRDRITRIGPTSKDEMCNFYVMYYTRNGNIVDQDYCGDENVPRNLNFPVDSDVLPPNLRHKGHGHVHMAGDSDRERSEVGSSKEAPLRKGSVLTQHVVAVGGTDPGTDLDDLVGDEERLVVDSMWPYEKDSYNDVGEVSAVAVNSDGDVVIFHRGPRVWDDSTFDEHHRLRRDIEPLKVPTVYRMDHKSGKILQKWGKDMFYLPHGLTIDSQNNIWLTDVGSHQVYKFSPPNFEVPSLALGRALIPGNGSYHFCQPADVAVEKSGVFYVADGYCNSRIMKFSPEGKFIKAWGKSNRNAFVRSRTPGEFSVPHSLALDEARQLIYVADRENGRIQCFNTDGEFFIDITKEEFGRVFAVSFSPIDGGTIYAINSPVKEGESSRGYTLSARSGAILGKWSPLSSEFQKPHDVCHSNDGASVYVSEIGPRRLWKFHKKARAHAAGSTASGHPSAVDDRIGIGGPAKSHNTSDYSSDIKTIHPDEDDPSVIPAIVVVVVLSTPISLICIAAIIQHLRLKHKRQRAIRKRNENSNLNRDKGCCSCWYTPKYYYDSKRGFDKLIGERSDSEDDLFARGAS